MRQDEAVLHELGRQRDGLDLYEGDEFNEIAITSTALKK